MEFELKTKSGSTFIVGIDKPIINVANKDYSIKPSILYIKGTKIENLTFCKFCHRYTGMGKNAERLFALEFTNKTAKEIGKIIGTKAENFCFALNEEVEAYVESLKPLAEKMLKQAIEDAEAPLRELDSKMTNDTLIKVYHGGDCWVRFEHTSPLARKLGNKLDMLNKKIKFGDMFKEYLKDTDVGDYIIEYKYEMPLGVLLEKIKEIEHLYEKKLVEETKKREEHDLKINLLKDTAKETGEKQEVNRWTEPCNDKNEECNVDICVEYAMPDGAFKVERFHTW